MRLLSIGKKQRALRRTAVGLFVAIWGLGLAGCMSTDQRYGISPVLDSAAVVEASAHQEVILRALAKDAGFDPVVGPVDWYAAAEAGFNYVDDQCRGYFDELFFLDRRRDRFKSGFITAGQTAAAILAITGGSSESLAIAAQAFGFSATATDLVAGTYLYSLPPSTTQGFVQRLQQAFRAAAAADHASIDTPTRAYYAVQQYLDLCLPPRIETEIGRQITSARAIPVVQGAGSFSVETVSQPANPNFVPPTFRTLVPSVRPRNQGSAVSKLNQPVPIRPQPAAVDGPPPVASPRPRHGVAVSPFDQPVPGTSPLQ